MYVIFSSYLSSNTFKKEEGKLPLVTFKKLYITVVFEWIYHFCILFLGCSLAVLDSFVTLIVFLITIYACEILVSIQLNENFSSREKCVSSQTVLFFRCFRFFFSAKTRVLNQLELRALMFHYVLVENSQIFSWQKV